MEPSRPLDQLPLEEQVAILKQQLAQARRMASLGELLGTTTHEFNNMLTTVINYAKMGLRHKDAPTRDKALDRILTASQRAAKITGSIMAIARSKSQKTEPTDRPVLVEDALAAARTGVEQVPGDGRESAASGSAGASQSGQIQQVLLNLLINARQAMPEGGRVLSSWLATNREDGRPDGSQHRPGIPAEILPRIFNRSSRPSKARMPRQRGAGWLVGLPRDYQTRPRPNSRRERVGRGAAFTLKLPICDSPTATPLPTAPPHVAPPPAVSPPQTH